MLLLPEVLNHFNLYNDAEKMIGQDGKIELPELTMINDTLNGSGVLGEIEDPVTGQFESASMKIKWAVLHTDFFKLVSGPVNLTLRASLQCLDTETGVSDYYPCKVVVRGKAKTINLGSMEKGKKMGCETEIEILYIKVTLDKETKIELDKLNFVYILNDVDMLEKIKSQI